MAEEQSFGKNPLTYRSIEKNIEIPLKSVFANIQKMNLLLFVIAAILMYLLHSEKKKLLRKWQRLFA